MINEGIMRFIPYGITVLLLIGYVFFFYTRYTEVQTQISSLETQRFSLQNKIKQLNKSNREKFEHGTDLFFNEQKYFEEYIREIFFHNQANIRQYRIQIEEKDRGIISVLFDIPILRFFLLLRELEEGKKLIIIKSISVRKKSAPYLQVQLKLEGYYK